MASTSSILSSCLPFFPPHCSGGSDTREKEWGGTRPANSVYFLLFFSIIIWSAECQLCHVLAVAIFPKTVFPFFRIEDISMFEFTSHQITSNHVKLHRKLFIRLAGELMKFWQCTLANEIPLYTQVRRHFAYLYRKKMSVALGISSKRWSLQSLPIVFLINQYKDPWLTKFPSTHKNSLL